MNLFLSRGILIPFFNVVVSGHILDGDITMFDVGHGDCLLIRNGHHEGLLIDCGAQNPSKYDHIPLCIESLVRRDNSCGILISHYHEDHYRLYMGFNHPNQTFSQVYLPNIPLYGPNQMIGRAMYAFMVVAMISLYPHFRIIPHLMKTFNRPIIFKQKSEHINEGGVDYNVLWPDIDNDILGTKSMINKAKYVLHVLEPILKEYEIRFPEDTRDLIELIRGLDLIISPSDSERFHKILDSLESSFSQFADKLSLVIQTSRGSMFKGLFLGDAPRPVLNRIELLYLPRVFDMIKASHHGTRFGKSLNGLITKFLLVSRNRIEKNVDQLNIRYLKNMHIYYIMNTEFLHTCHIK